MLGQSSAGVAPALPRRRMRPSRRLAAAVLEMAPAATVVTDMAGTIGLVNHHTEVLFGYPRQELLGQPVELLLPEYWRTVHQQWRADAAGAHSPPLGIAVPFLGRRRDGREFPVEITFARLEQDGEPLLIASVRETHDVQRMQGATQQLQRMLAVTDTALAHLELDALLPELLPRVRDVMGADIVAILLLEPDGQELTVRAESRLAQGGPAAASVPVGVGLAGRVAASRQPLIVDDVSRFPLARPHLRETIRSAMGVPLVTGERLLGVLSVGAAQTHHFSQQDVALLEQAAERITVAIERAQLFEAEQAARYEAERERARWHAAMESAPELVITCDADLRITYVNPAYVRLRGSPADPLVPVEERPGRYGLFLPDGQSLFPAEQLPLSRAVREGRPVHDVQIVLHTPQGEERLVEWGAAPMYSALGELLGAVAIGHDVTEHRQMQRATQELAAQLQATLDTMNDAVFLYDTAGQVLQLNAAAQALIDALPARPPVSGTSWRERVESYHPRRPDGSPLPLEERPLARVLRGEVLTAAKAQDVVMTDALGHDLVLNYRGGPARDVAEQLIGYVFVVRDVTERRRMQREREEALVASEAWFHTLADTAPVLVWVSGPDGLVTFVNLPWLRFTGRPLERELGNGWAEGVHPDDYERCLQTYRTAFQARERFTMEYRLRCADGEYRWLVDTGVPRFAPDGTFLGYIGSGMDISDRLQLEQEREEARVQAERRAEELDRVFEAVADGVAVYDQDGRMVRANAALRHLLGLDAAPPDFAQLSLHERMALFAIRDAHGHPLAPDAEPLLRALDGNILAGAEAMDERLRTLDGRDVELLVSAAPLQTPTGQLVGAVCVYRDVTEHKRLERKLAEQAEQLDRIVEGMGEGLFVYDMEGHVVRTNAAARRILGLDGAPLDFSALAAEARLALYAPDAKQQSPLLTPAEWLAARSRAGGDVLSESEARDICMHTLDGRELEVSASMAPLRNPDGQVVGGVLLLSDRTERNQLMREREEGLAHQLAAQELAQQLDQFFAMAAHDIRTPLAALTGSVQYARRRLQRLEAVQQAREAQDADLTTPLAAALDHAQNSVQSLSRLVDRLFDVARARSGALTLDLAALDLAALVREHVAAQQIAVPERCIELHLPERPVLVVGDAVRLGQVVTNYLSNALKYSADNQPVTVRLTVTGHVARLSVEDRGAGLSPEQQTHVWDLYHQVSDVPVHRGASANLESQGVGLGLGLYIVKRLVELHPGGQVGVDSVVGQGSTFWFNLPLAVSAEAL